MRLHFETWAYNQHDNICNQMYAVRHPYSFHLKMVALQADRFINLIPISRKEHVYCAIAGHDLIEDARITYNDIITFLGKYPNPDIIADVIYACTEEKGRNRKERHSDKYYKELASNELAVFVKLCDIIANIKYSLLTESSMFKKYKEEWIGVKYQIFNEKYTSMFDYVDNILKIQ